jgi:hypothetical protein
MPVDAPEREDDAMAAEGSEPGNRVVVVGVDERAVDVEYRDRLGIVSRRHC